jgi:hypothetical protein
VNGVMDIKLKQEIEAGRQAGPDIDATAPYLNGPKPFLQMHGLRDPDDARRQVAYWADMGGDILQDLHEHQPCAARRRDRGGAQAWHEGDRPSLLRDVRRGGRPGHRQPRAWVLRLDRFRGSALRAKRDDGWVLVEVADENKDPIYFVPGELPTMAERSHRYMSIQEMRPHQ